MLFIRTLGNNKSNSLFFGQKMFKQFVSFVVLMSCLLPSVSFASSNVRFVTESLPPLQIGHNNAEPTGAMIDVIKEVIKEAGFNSDIEVYPWARTYRLGQQQKNTFIFSILRSDNRENLFQWVGELYTIRAFLAGRKDRAEVNVDTLADAQHYKIGVIRDSQAETYLKSKGFSEPQHLYISQAYSGMWANLFNKNTDIAFTNNTIWRPQVEKAGLDAENIALLYEVKDFASVLYLAASPNTDKQLVEKAKSALKKIKQDGRYATILAKWQLD